MSLPAGTAASKIARHAGASGLDLAEGPAKFGPERSGDRHGRIYKELRERLSLLRYAPGTVLSEVELAAEFEVSRTPMRRVLQRLHHEGLVEIRNGVGTIVTDIDIKTMKEIYDLRMCLAELMGVLSPSTITDAQLEAMADLLARAKGLRRDQDFEAYARLCNDLEELLVSMVGSAPLREITDLFYYRVSRIWFTFLPNLDWPEVVRDQEAEIGGMLEAMKRGDLRGVGQIRRMHLQRILTKVSRYLLGEVGSMPPAQPGIQ